MLPEAFLAVDAILMLAADVACGLEVREAVIRGHVARELPFMATERCLMLGVKAGGDRQALHEVIRRHSLEVARAVAETGAANDLLDRLAADPAFRGVARGRGGARARRPRSSSDAPPSRSTSTCARSWTPCWRASRRRRPTEVRV